MSKMEHLLSQYGPEDLLDLSRRAVLQRFTLQRRALAAFAASEAARFYKTPAAEIYGVQSDGVRCAMRPNAIKARAVAIYILTTVFSMRRDEVGELYGVTYNLVKKAIRRVEEQRDEDPALECLLDQFEGLVALEVRAS